MNNDGEITWIRKEIVEYGWRCNMTDDDCDVMFYVKKIEIFISLKFVSIIVYTEFASKCSILNSDIYWSKNSIMEKCFLWFLPTLSQHYLFVSLI